MAIPIRFGGYQPARSVHSRAVRQFGEILKQRLGAAVDFQFTENVTQARFQAEWTPVSRPESAPILKT